MYNWRNWQSEAVCDIINLVLGAFLFLTPWIFAYPAGPESTNAYICGIVIAALSIAALAAFADWEEWLNLIVGLWVIVSPWVLGFADRTAIYVHVIVGVLVAALAGIELWVRHSRPPSVPAH